jgi:hypothetical protein
MFQDIDVSKTLMVEYEKYCETHHVTGIGMTKRQEYHLFNYFILVDFSVMVLSSNSWPFSASSNFVLPIEVDDFDDFVCVDGILFLVEIYIR